MTHGNRACPNLPTGELMAPPRRRRGPGLPFQHRCPRQREIAPAPMPMDRISPWSIRLVTRRAALHDIGSCVAFLAEAQGGRAIEPTHTASSCDQPAVLQDSTKRGSNIAKRAPLPPCAPTRLMASGLFTEYSIHAGMVSHQNNHMGAT